jgi:hypothetical protein
MLCGAVADVQIDWEPVEKFPVAMLVKSSPL